MCMLAKLPSMDLLLSSAVLYSLGDFSMEGKFYHQFVPKTQDEQTSAALKKDIGMH